MAYKTTAFDAADALGWDMDELARRSGVPSSTLYEIRRGRRNVGPRTIPGLRKAFPHLSFEQLFLPSDSAIAERVSVLAGPPEVAA